MPPPSSPTKIDPKIIPPSSRSMAPVSERRKTPKQKPLFSSAFAASSNRNHHPKFIISLLRLPNRWWCGRSPTCAAQSTWNGEASQVKKRLVAKTHWSRRVWARKRKRRGWKRKESTTSIGSVLGENQKAGNKEFRFERKSAEEEVKINHKGGLSNNMRKSLINHEFWYCSMSRGLIDGDRSMQSTNCEFPPVQEIGISLLVCNWKSDGSEAGSVTLDYVRRLIIGSNRCSCVTWGVEGVGLRKSSKMARVYGCPLRLKLERWCVSVVLRSLLKCCERYNYLVKDA